MEAIQKFFYALDWQVWIIAVLMLSVCAVPFIELWSGLFKKGK